MVRQIRIEGALAFVPLTRGMEAIIDVDMAQVVGEFNWNASQPKPGSFYACRTEERAGVGRRVYLHRFIMGEPDCLVDHRDHNTLDCRRSNLRPANRVENSANQVLGSNNSSGFKGVVFRKRGGTFEASIGGERTYLGRFATAEDAAAAYNKAAADRYGDFSLPN